jgi:hypothetical protein
VEDIIAVTFIFGGGALFLLAVSPVGRAFADRLRHGPQPLHGGDADPAVWEELDRLRGEMTELQERVDFAERLLAKGNEAQQRDQALGQGS